jgi:hypothetical protein
MELTPACASDPAGSSLDRRAICESCRCTPPHEFKLSWGFERGTRSGWHSFSIAGDTKVGNSTITGASWRLQDRKDVIEAKRHFESALRTANLNKAQVGEKFTPEPAAVLHVRYASAAGRIGASRATEQTPCPRLCAVLVPACCCATSSHN